MEDSQQPKKGAESPSLSPGSARVGRRLLARLGQWLARFLVFCFGRVAWQAPGWWQSLRVRTAGISRRTGWFVALSLLLVSAAGAGLYQYQKLLDRKAAAGIQIQVEAPEPTDYGQRPSRVHPLRLRFAKAVAPLEQLDRKVDSGVALAPGIPGQWHWQSDRELVFTPAQDWPVGQRFQVKLQPRKLVVKGAMLAKTQLDFRTAPFKPQIQRGEFYLDPQHPTQKKVIFTLDFNYPVDPRSLEASLQLHYLQPDLQAARGYRLGAKEGFTVNYDPTHLHAYVHSAPVQLTSEQQVLELRIAKGVQSRLGGPVSDQELQEKVRVPGLYSLEIQHMELRLVNNERAEPIQTLLIPTSQPVQGKELAAHIQAWLLPPEGPHGEKNYQWSFQDLSRSIPREAQPVPLQWQPGEREYDVVQGFRFSAPPGRYLYVRTQAGLKGYGGFLAAKSYGQVLRVPDYPKLLRILGEGSLLPLSGDHRLSVVARNVPGLQLEIGRVLPDQLQHLVSLNRGDFRHPRLEIGPNHLVERYRLTQELNHGDPGKAEYTGLSLDPYFGGEKRKGIFLLRLSSWNPRHDRHSDSFSNSFRDGDNNDSDNDEEAADSRLVVVTDLGLIAKRSLDDSLDVFVQSISTGAPVANVLVQVLAINGQSLMAAQSDASGHVHFASLKGFDREQKPALLTAASAGDFSFLPLAKWDRTLRLSRFDVDGEENARSPGELSAYLFSDRGLYRPGEQFHVGMILHSANWQSRYQGLPLELELQDPRGLTVAREHLVSDANGFLEWSQQTAESAPTGPWSVNLYLQQGQKKLLLGSTTLQVQEFAPDQTKVQAQWQPARPKGWLHPKDLRVRITANTLYGTPANGRRVTATLHLAPSLPAFASWQGYRFYAPHSETDGNSEALPEQRTNAQGQVLIPLDLSSYAAGSYQLRFFAQVYEADSGRSVGAELSTLVSSADYLVGIKNDGPLRFISRGATRKLRLVAVNPDLQSIAVSQLQAQILDRHYVSVLARTPSGIYQYQSKLVETPKKTIPLSIPTGGMELTLPTQEPGDYVLLIQDAQGKVLNREEYSVAGNANLSRSLERNAELQIHLDKSNYAAGDEIQLALRAPYPGHGLLTIERDKVYAWSWFHAREASSVQHIRIPHGLEGNAYVHVEYVRDPAAQDIYVSPLSYGVVPFTVDRSAHQQALTLRAPERIRPGQTLTVHLHSQEPTQVALFAVDAGILQVAHYRLGDPLDYFFRKRRLDVKTEQILDLILPSFAQFLGESRVGGDADSARRQQLNPFPRPHEAPVAYWSGIVQVDGDRDFHYQVPDYFNGQLRIMAVAVAGEKIGIAQTQTYVRGDYVLTPNVPWNVAPGDRFEVSVQVVNNLENSPQERRPVAVRLGLDPGLEAQGPVLQELRLAPGESGVVRFPVRAGPRLGSQRLRFEVVGPTKGVARTVSLSVRPPEPLLSTLQLGQFAPGRTQRLTGLRELYPQHASRELTVSYLPLAMMGGLQSYLDHYTHLCTEQVVSAATPALIVAVRPEFARSAEARAKAQDGVRRAIAVLRNRQNEEGGFGLWTATPSADPFVSVYAMNYLLEARQSGLAVPNDLWERGLGYLQKLAGDESLDTLSGLRNRAFAIYLLTRTGQVTTNYLAAVQSRLGSLPATAWRADLVAVYLAASHHLLKDEDTAQRLIEAPYRKLVSARAMDSDWTYADYLDPLIEKAQTLQMVERYFPGRAARIPPGLWQAIQAEVNGQRYNSLSAALLLDALADLSGGPVPPTGLRLEERLPLPAGQGASWQPFGSAQGSLLRGAWSAAARELRIVSGRDSGTPAQIWYALSQTGYDRSLPKQKIEQGLEILRQYTDATGKPLQQVALGQDVFVHIRLRAQKEPVDNVAIVDILPGGFTAVTQSPVSPDAATHVDAAAGSEEDSQGDGEGSAAGPGPVRDRLALSGSTLEVDHVDLREDRVLIYARAGTEAREYVYRIRASNQGTFQLAPVYAESLYDRSKKALVPSPGNLVVVAPAN
ncbi:MAG: alpha-2-macroglobulin family protein [Acidithiobacillus sp.]|nr:alpha-2-macroglobulin family protein [Acidithiobacillus sp.]